MPIDRAAPFALHEMFFSMTDRKGHIVSGNEIFARVSGYDRATLIGAAHNIIRHPDMPRAVFEVFWRYLLAGRPVAAYVKNLAADGAYYWVMAVVVPTADGFLSVRIKPSTEFMQAAEGLYAELTALEARVENGQPRNRKQAIDAAVTHLEQRLRDLGYESYDAFMRVALPAEVLARQAGLQESATRGADRGDGESALGAVLAACIETDRMLDSLVATLNEYGRLSETLTGKSEFVLDLADDVRLFSLNALLAAARLGRGGAALGAVAHLMRQRSDQTAPAIQAAIAEIASTLDGLADVGFRIGAGKLQTEMLMQFVVELRTRGDDGHAALDDLTALAASMRAEIDGVLAALGDLDRRIGVLMDRVAVIDRDLAVLSTLELNGRVEAARDPGAGDVGVLFNTISRQVGAARDEMGDFRSVGELSGSRAHEDVGPTIQAHVDEVVRRIAAIGAGEPAGS